MACAIDLDEVVTQISTRDDAFEVVDVKPQLGSSKACAYVLPHIEGTFTTLECFKRTRLGELTCFGPSATRTAADFNPDSALAAAGLDHFVDLISKWKDVDAACIESFVMSYNAPERKSLVRGQWVYTTADSIADVFKVPDSGENLSVVRSDETYILDDCFLHPRRPGESDDDHIQIADIRLDWRPWLELVHVYLQVRPTASFVDRGTVRVAVAIRQGVRINWALHLARNINKCLNDFKSSPGELLCASYIYALVEARCPRVLASPLLPMLPKPDPESSVKMNPESSSSSKASVVDPVASQNVLTQFRIWMSEGGNERDKAEIQSLKNDNAALKTQLENYRIQVEKQCQRLVAAESRASLLREQLDESNARLQEMEDSVRLKHQELEACKALVQQLKIRAQTAESEVIGLKGKGKDVQHKSADDNDKSKQLEQKYIWEKGSREMLEQWKRLAEVELTTLREFHSHYAYLSAPEENDLLAAFADDVNFIEAGFVSQLPQSVSFSSLNELLKFVPPAGGVEEAYLLEREIFFIHTGLSCKEFVSDLKFQFLWKKAMLLGSENLFTEIIVRGDIVLESPAPAYYVVGDYGARILKFHSSLEATLASRRHSAAIYASNQRKVEGQWLATGVAEHSLQWDDISTNKSKTLLYDWQQGLHHLLEDFATHASMHTLVKNCQVRTTLNQKNDVHPATYLKSYHAVRARLQAKITAKSVSELPWVNIDAEFTLHAPQVDEKVDPLPGTFTDLVAWMPPYPNSTEALDNHYLGMWPHLFSEMCAEPFPTWEAIAWIGKDHTRIDRSPRLALGVLERLNKVRRSQVAPQSVRSDPKFCPCPRRYSWAADAKLDSAFYNWPIIPGHFETPQLCTESYSRFSKEHRFHHDPVCFRASIFAAILAFWCEESRISVDYRVGARFSNDMVIFNSIQFHSSRRIRMLELMCQMQFLRDAHEVMIGDSFEEIGTRRIPSFNCMDKRDFNRESTRELGAYLKAEEAINVNSYKAELARVQGKGKQKQLTGVETESQD